MVNKEYHIFQLICLRFYRKIDFHVYIKTVILQSYYEINQRQFLEISTDGKRKWIKTIKAKQS